jgi:FkbM family methyltransferase
MKDFFYDIIWSLATSILHVTKQFGLSGPFEELFEKAGNLLVPPPREDVEVLLSFGSKLILPGGFPRLRSYTSGIYEKEVSKAFRDRLKEGMGVVDVGAFCGYYTLLSSMLVGRGGHVYAFEPDPKNFQYLSRNIALNGRDNVVAVKLGVSDKKAQATLSSDGFSDKSHISETIEDGSKLIEIQTVDLDSYFSALGWPMIDLIKMDIEGGELSAVMGMRELVARNPGLCIIMEINPSALLRLGASPDKIFDQLHSYGFEEGLVIEQGRKFSLDKHWADKKAVYDVLVSKNLSTS